MFRTSTIIAAVTALLLGLSAVTVTASTDKDPFIGRWKSIDIDGSNNQTLTFRRSGNVLDVRLFDNDATQACESGGPAELEGTGGDTPAREFLDRRTAINVRYETLTCRRGNPNPELELPVPAPWPSHVPAPSARHTPSGITGIR